MSLNEAAGSPLNLPETWEECVELGMPDTAEARGHWERAREAEANILAALRMGTRPTRQYAKKVEPAHKLSEDERRARRTRNRSRRQKALAARTAPEKGKQAWKARAKRINRMAKNVETQYPSVDPRKTAKRMLEIEAELIGVIETHVIGQRKEPSGT